jgi:hypothetical protein
MKSLLEHAVMSICQLHQGQEGMEVMCNTFDAMKEAFFARHRLFLVCTNVVPETTTQTNTYTSIYAPC